MRRGRLWRLAGRLRRRLAPSPVEEPTLPPELGSDYSAEELREFLDGGLPGTPAAAEFQERLRRELWARLERRSARDDRS